MTTFENLYGWFTFVIIYLAVNIFKYFFQKTCRLVLQKNGVATGNGEKVTLRGESIIFKKKERNGKRENRQDKQN